MKHEYNTEQAFMLTMPHSYGRITQPQPLRWWERVLAGLGVIAWLASCAAVGYVIGQALKH